MAPLLLAALLAAAAAAGDPEPYAAPDADADADLEPHLAGFNVTLLFQFFADAEGVTSSGWRLESLGPAVQGQESRQRLLLPVNPDSGVLLDLKAKFLNPPLLSSWTGSNPCSGWLGVSCDSTNRVSILELAGLKLNGTIAPSVGNLSNLVTLHLQDNLLKGPLPTTIGNLLNLVLLNVDNNMLTGSIPLTIGRLAKLELIHLANNQMEGSIPTAINNLSSLVIFIVDNNRFTGLIPSGLEKLTHLSKLQIARNKLTGSITNGIGRIVNLTVLDLSMNMLTGSIPTNLGSLRKLGIMYLYHNNLAGPIPAKFGDLTALKKLNLSMNSLSGPFPAAIKKLVNQTGLNILDVSSNYLNGPQPLITAPHVNTRFLLNCFGANSFGQKSAQECGSFYKNTRYCIGDDFAACEYGMGYPDPNCGYNHCVNNTCQTELYEAKNCYVSSTGADFFCNTATCDSMQLDKSLTELVMAAMASAFQFLEIQAGIYAMKRSCLLRLVTTIFATRMVHACEVPSTPTFQHVASWRIQLSTRVAITLSAKREHPLICGFRTAGSSCEYVRHDDFYQNFQCKLKGTCDAAGHCLYNYTATANTSCDYISGNDFCSTQKCRNGTCAKIAPLSDGASCTRAMDPGYPFAAHKGCATASCMNGKCTLKLLADGTSCNTTAINTEYHPDCVSGKCSKGFCKLDRYKPVNSLCGDPTCDSDCCSYCDGGGRCPSQDGFGCFCRTEPPPGHDCSCSNYHCMVF
eukprot:SM000024S07729  [mRNA]  locus=s24:30736:37341:- [translate_table: standard]